ncbi:hypothetical protein ScPMuIL_006077 [Solemya velum]
MFPQSKNKTKLPNLKFWKKKRNRIPSFEGKPNIVDENPYESIRTRKESVTSPYDVLSKSKRNQANKLMVAAIDFGTTYSGYAFSFRHEYDRDPAKVHGRLWQSKTGLLASMKTPTGLLLNPDTSFAAFGYEAENIYNERALTDEHKEYYFFQKFKMVLYNKTDIDRDMQMADINGKWLPSRYVFSVAIRYMMDEVLESCKGQVDLSLESDILWVLTTPAIWSDAAKQFMRESAIEAGIPDKDLVIALEPEAASVFCSHIPMLRTFDDRGDTYREFVHGEQYVVLDAGGGTVDITVHEVKDDRSLRELSRASGGAWGGDSVNEEFRLKLIDTMGESSLETFVQRHTEDYLELFREFELKKKDLKPNTDGRVVLRLPYSFRRMYDARIKRLGKNQKHVDEEKGVSVSKDKMIIQASEMKKCFEKAISSITEHLKEILFKPEMLNVNSILMVGGFSESILLQTAVADTFPEMRLVVPQEAGSAVLKGAVIYGHRPHIISERKCKYTYGLRIYSKFQKGVHDPSKKHIANGVDICEDIFSKHVEIGQTLRVGEVQSSQFYRPTWPDQKAMYFEVYASTDRQGQSCMNAPIYVTDPSCIKLGKLMVPMNDVTGGENRGVRVCMFYSGTELGVEATGETDGAAGNVRALFDFLG